MSGFIPCHLMHGVIKIHLKSMLYAITFFNILGTNLRHLFFIFLTSFPQILYKYCTLEDNIMLKESGVYQLENGLWAYRFSLIINHKRISRKKTTDEYGNKLKNKNAALKARAAAINKLHTHNTPNETIPNKTVAEIYNEYCEKGRSGKAYTTILKQDSLWKNHLSSAFGNKLIKDISVAEINDYLCSLYYEKGYSYKYVESFLKMFYLIWGQAYTRDYLDMHTYNKLCQNKESKIHMPPLKTDEDTDIVSFSKEDLSVLDDYFINTNAETAYKLGRYCGLRINECYGLKWDHINLTTGTILIDRQMQYQEGLIKLVPPKTRNAKRTIYMSEKLKLYLSILYQANEIAKIKFKRQREQNQTFITDLDGHKISSLELVNCLPNGKIQTVNSMKYHSRILNEEYHIQFKFHYLRHTYGTLMAELNTPTHLLCNQMGHGNIHVTQLYYLAISKKGIDILQANLDKL